MRKFFRNCFCAIALLIICMSFTACGGSVNVKYDLTTSDTMATTVINKIESNPYSYKGQTIKVRGKLKGNSSYYTLNENATCCNWSFEVKMDKVSESFKTNSNITIVGKCVVEKTDGHTSWYVDVLELA